MSYIEFKEIEKFYNDQHVLKNLNLSIEKGKFVTLLGPSGCGKSTLLRCLAGLESISKGIIYLDGEDITYKTPKQRNIGMIFQQYSLFPTMNVYNNISFGLRMQKEDKDKVNDKVEKALKMVELIGKEKKFPSQLSGGEQQRVALARCIVTSPKVLLLDEPFSAIDAKLRKSLQSRIKEIHTELSMTSIFVTHDQDEAMTMSDVIHLMNKGVIEQSATPIELYSEPKTQFAASFMGNYNIINSKDINSLMGHGFEGDKIVIRPETIEISLECFTSNEQNIVLKGIINDIVPQGNILRYLIRCNNLMLKVDVLFNKNTIYKVGEEVFLKINVNNIIEY